MRGPKRNTDEKHGIRIPGTLLDELKTSTNGELFFLLDNSKLPANIVTS